MKKLYVSICLSPSLSIYLKPVMAGGEGRRLMLWLKNKYPSGGYNLLRIDDKYVDEEYIINSFKEDNEVTRWFKRLDKVKEYRNDPVVFCEEVLGIKIPLYQKDMLTWIWNNPNRKFMSMGRIHESKYLRKSFNRMNKILYKEGLYVKKTNKS